ncbi:MAG: transketolase family protein [Eubacterium sp.]|jgi:transketolase|nr:transketolase family protein [Eubacterium sp.]
MPINRKLEELPKIATREGYGNTLVELGKEDENIVVLDADLAAATKTNKFAEAFPDRHINCGIAEANMAGIAAGLAASGKTPFISSFAMFVSGRAYEQIRNSIGYPGLNVKIGASHAGISVGEDGATHQCNEDIALMRSIPGMMIVNPSDDIEARAAVRAAYAHKGPVYLRFGRLAVPVFNDREDYHFELGKGIVLREGKDATVFATGLCVVEALYAADMLAEAGIDVELINIHTIKPLDTELVCDSAAKTGRVFTIEEHSIIGGLGSAVCETLSERQPVKVTRIGMNDVYGESGPAVELLHKFGLDAEGIFKKIKETLEID